MMFTGASTYPIMSWIVSPASTCPPWLLMYTLIGADESVVIAINCVMTRSATSWSMPPLITMVRAVNRRSAYGSTAMPTGSVELGLMRVGLVEMVERET